MSAIEELRGFLEPGEMVEAIIFGGYGWCSNDGELGYKEPEDRPVPLDKRGVLLTLTEAEPFMRSWSFDGGYGAPQCYAVNIWTDRRVIWVHEYDGSTCLASAPRHPVPGMRPVMS